MGEWKFGDVFRRTKPGRYDGRRKVTTIPASMYLGPDDEPGWGIIIGLARTTVYPLGAIGRAHLAKHWERVDE